MGDPRTLVAWLLLLAAERPWELLVQQTCRDKAMTGLVPFALKLQVLGLA